jgi:hypothetical protein
VKVESFFNFFKDEENVLGKLAEKGEEDPEDGGEPEAGAVYKDEQQDIGEQIKDDLIPLALEYYLGVIELNEDDQEGFDS